MRFYIFFSQEKNWNFSRIFSDASCYVKVWRYRFSSFWIFAFLTWKIYVESIGWIWPWKYRQFDVVLCYNHLIIFSTDKNNQFLELFLTYKNFEISQKRLKEGIIVFFGVLRTSRGLNVHKILHKSYWQILRKLRISKTSRPQKLFRIFQKNCLYDFL